jgi:hypothetical protein
VVHNSGLFCLTRLFFGGGFWSGYSDFFCNQLAISSEGGVFLCFLRSDNFRNPPYSLGIAVIEQDSLDRTDLIRPE